MSKQVLAILSAILRRKMAAFGSVCLSWRQHDKSLSCGMWKLLQEEAVVDVELECEGHVFYLHKLVLVASCLYFKENVSILSVPGRVTLRLHDDIGIQAKHQDVKSIINFMYLGEIAVMQDRLQAVMVIAQLLGIYGLEELILTTTSQQALPPNCVAAKKSRLGLHSMEKEFQGTTAGLRQGFNHLQPQDGSVEPEEYVQTNDNNFDGSIVGTPEPYVLDDENSIVDGVKNPKLLSANSYSYLFSEEGVAMAVSGSNEESLSACDLPQEAEDLTELPEKMNISVQTDIDMWNMDSVFQRHQKGRNAGGQSEDSTGDENYFVSVFEDADIETGESQSDVIYADDGDGDSAKQSKVLKSNQKVPEVKRTRRKEKKQKKITNVFAENSELEGLLSDPNNEMPLSEISKPDVQLSFKCQACKDDRLANCKVCCKEEGGKDEGHRPHLRSAATLNHKSRGQQRQKEARGKGEWPVQPDPKHSKDHPIDCRTCGEHFSSREAVKLHVWKSHKLGPVFKCNLCEHVTPIKSSFMKHLSTHKDTKDFSCRICGKKFKSRGGLNIHIRSHQGDNFMFKCNHCVFKTLQKFNLIKHLATKHGKDMDGKDLPANFKCPECDYMCIAEHMLKSHMLRKHTVDKPFKCNECEYATVEKAALEKHVRIRHTHERPYMCEVCGFSSHTISGIARHRRSHTGVKPYKCEECGQQYADRKRLRDHMLKHANEKPFICEVCGYAFRRKDNLQAHLRKNHLGGGGEVVREEEEGMLAVTQPQEEVPQAPAYVPVGFAEDVPQVPYEDVDQNTLAAVTSECGGGAFSATFTTPSLIYVNNGTMHMGYYMTSSAVMPQAVTQVVTSAVVPSSTPEAQQQELILVRTSPMIASAQATEHANVNASADAGV